MNEEWKAIKQRIEAAGLPVTRDLDNPLTSRLAQANLDRRRLDEMLCEAMEERDALTAEVKQLKDRIAKFIDGENGDDK